MRRSDRQRSAQIWQRVLDATLSLVVGGFVLSVISVATGLAPVLFSSVSMQLANVPTSFTAATEQTTMSWYRPIVQELQVTWSATMQTLERIFSGRILQYAQVGADPPSESLPIADIPTTSTGGVLPLATNPAAGTLRINAPLLIDDTLVVTGAVTLSTTTIRGLVTASSSLFESVTVVNELSAGAAAIGPLTADSLVVGPLTASTIAGASLTLSGTAEAVVLLADAATFGDLSVTGLFAPETLAVTGAAQIGGLLTATGGLTTDGADIDAGTGQVFASNIVNRVVAGQGILISGTQQEPIIGVDTDDLVGVLSINDETGELNLVGGTDITVSGLTIQNTANLASVRARGGCVDCITDTDVRSDLTLSGGTINNTPIGETAPSTGRFTNLTVGTSTATTTLAVGGAATIDDVLTVEGSATSTFQGSINLIDGCFAIGGVCVEGIAPSSYVGLTDTPGSLLPNAIQFANASNTALMQDGNFVFRDGLLGVGTSTPVGVLTVVGTSTLFGTLQVESGTSSQFVGGINVTAGCVAVDGVCLGGVDNVAGLSDVNIATATSGDLFGFDGTDWRNVDIPSLGLGDGRFIGLSDTPSTLTERSILFADATGSEVIQDAEFVYDGGQLGVGTTDLRSRLTVGGDVSVLGAQALRWYDSSDLYAVGLRAPSVLSTTTVWTLPEADGGPNQLLVTDGFGNLRFDDVSSVGGASTFLQLGDTPTGYTVGSIPFVNESNNALIQSSSFVFRDGRLGVGVSDPNTSLTVQGSVRWQHTASPSRPGLTYGLGGINRFGFGTEIPTEFIDIRGGSLIQQGGTASQTYAPSTVVGAGRNLEGGARAMDVAGNLAYVVTDNDAGDNFYILDVTNPRNPVEISRTSLSSSPIFESGRAITVSGRYAYVGTIDASNTENFYVVDIGNPLDPQVVSVQMVAGGVRDLVVAGQYIYLASNVNLRVLDISDPTEPVEIDSLSLSNVINSLVVSGTYLYAVTDAGVGSPEQFRIIDISDPLAISPISGFELGNNARDLAVRGQYAYIVTRTTAQTLRVLDISDPTEPTDVTTLNLNRAANSITVTGRYLYIGTDLPPTGASNNHTFFVVDALDPGDPALVGSTNPNVGIINDIFMAGRYAFVASSPTGSQFSVVDVTGAELQTAIVHALESGEMMVQGNALVGGRLVAGLGVRTGQEGVQTDGQLAVLGSGASQIAGRLSVGTSTATQRLTVAGDTALFGSLFDSQGRSGDVGALLMSGLEGIEWVASSTLTIAPSGYVGIGTSTPNQLLTVAGTIQSTDLLGGTAPLATDAQGNIIRGSSDARLKRNVQNIDNALNTVLALRGVRYEWVDVERFGPQTETGFLAQEVDTILPEAVRRGGEYWSLLPGNILAVVVEAFKELWQEVTGTKQEVAELEMRVRELELQLSGETTTNSEQDTDHVPTVHHEPTDATDTTDHSTSSADSLPNDNDTDTTTQTEVIESSMTADTEEMPTELSETDTNTEVSYESGDDSTFTDVVTSEAVLIGDEESQE